MKKSILILVHLIALAISGKLLSQASPTNSFGIVSPEGIFDIVYDRFGNQYPLSTLNLTSSHSIGGSFSVNSPPTNSCNAGYFTLWFAPGSLCDVNNTAKLLMCDIFSDISGLLSYSNSPLSSTSNTIKVNILCDDVPATSTFSSAAALASPFFVFPYSPSNPNPGIIESQVQKTIITASDPYFNIPVTFNNGTTFYHGAVYTNTNVNWNYSTSATTITSGSYDFYSIILHEVGHLLGVLSLINSDGYSSFGQANNYFGVYDRFLFDSSGNPLLTSSTSTSCPNSNISFAPASTSVIVAGSCTNTSSPTDITNCSTAPQYSSTNVHIPYLYAPNCWETGSSLSHFEDMCGTLGGTISTSCYTANANSNNNLYYAMANFAGSNSCYVKRFYKEEERKVLCDLGYSVSATYTSNAVIDGTLSTHSYTAGACSPTAIVLGLNDGLVGGSYIYTTTGTSTVIPFSTILANDLPSTASVSCLELVYSNSATLTPGSSDFTVSAPASSGLVLVKYLPKNSSGQYGNATYVYIYFAPVSCNPGGMCNLVNNGGFETAYNCGELNISSAIYANCWFPISGVTALYSAGCTGNSNSYNLGNNTLGTPSGTPLNSYIGTGNNNVFGLTWYNFSTYSASPGVVKNNLSSPVIPTHTYQLSLFANNYLNASANNTNPVVISVATNSVFAYTPNGTFPNALDVIAEFTLYPGTNWTQLTHTFVFTPSVSANHYALIVGIDQVKTLAIPGTTWNPSTSSIFNPGNGIFCFIDDVSLAEFPIPTFSIPSPTICGNQSFTNLAQYASTTGVFSGQGVTTNTLGQQDFNLNLFMQPGVYPIAFTYSSSVNTCTNTIYELVTIGSNTNYVALTPVNLCISNPTLDLNSVLTNTTITGTTYSIGGVQVSSPYTFTASGQYALSASNTSTTLCSNSVYTTLVSVYDAVAPWFTNGGFTVNSATLCNGNSYNLTANTSNTIFDWQPGGLTNASEILSPTVTTIYTVTVYDYSLCAASSTFAVIVATNCCNGASLTPFTGTAISSPTVYTGSLLISNDVTIPSYQLISFADCNIQFLNNAKIIIEDHSLLSITGCHLSSCDNTTWGGIVLHDGARLSASSGVMDNLIEDAVTAIDVSNYSSQSYSVVLDIHNTTFNKNYIGISISNYTESINPYPFKIDNCVFTCRDLSSAITATSWPQTGTVNPTDLRLATASPTALEAPYLDPTVTGFPLTTLKAPHTTQPSQTAILLSTVGGLGGSTPYAITIGEESSPSNFNLFDAHNKFIDATNSNIKSYNNVFQNTQYISGQGVGIRSVNYYTNIGTMSNMLNLTSPTTPTLNINRFYDCHYGVLTKNTASLDIQYAEFKSTQSSTAAASATNTGQFGVFISGNRFINYKLNYNNFYNVSKGIYAGATSGSISVLSTGTVPVTYGQVWGSFLITNNLFSSTAATLTGNEFVSDGVIVENALYTKGGGSVAGTSFYTVSPAQGIRIQYNIFENVWRGVRINNFTNSLFDKWTANNSISLTQDVTTSNEQWGVKYESTWNSIVNTNTITGFTSSLSSITQGVSETMGINSGVQCNSVVTVPVGFEFKSANPGTVWRNNIMNDNSYGIELSTNGYIGQQGSYNNPSDNAWEGTWTGNWHTYTTNSDAVNSRLYRRNFGDYDPTLNSGLVGALTFSFAGNLQLANNAASYSGCAFITPPRGLTWAPRKRVTYNDVAARTINFGGDSDTEEINDILLYRDLHQDTILRESSDTLLDFYDTNNSTSLGILTTIEEYLSEGLLDEAGDALDDFTSSTTIETNYKDFYTLYLSYLADPAYFTASELTYLYTLAHKCPFTDGPVVYNARVLYNLATEAVETYNDTGCELSEDERKSFSSTSKDKKQINLLNNYQFYPNPAVDELNIVGPEELEEVQITVIDLSGRTLLNQKLTMKAYNAHLKLSLLNGVYFVTLINKDYEQVTKKLVISK